MRGHALFYRKKKKANNDPREDQDRDAHQVTDGC
jgi:hypothetical protein